MDIDHLNSASRTNTAKVAYRLIDRLQDFPANEQVTAVAVLFSIFARELKLPPQRLLGIANNITKLDNLFKDEQDKVFVMLADYVGGEIANG